jgi:hypothetical protein
MIEPAISITCRWRSHWQDPQPFVCLTCWCALHRVSSFDRHIEGLRLARLGIVVPQSWLGNLDAWNVADLGVPSNWLIRTCPELVAADGAFDPQRAIEEMYLRMLGEPNAHNA